MGIFLLIITVWGFYRLQSKMLTFRFSSKYYFPAYFITFVILVLQNRSSDWFPQLPLKFVFTIAAIIYPIFLYKDGLSKRSFWSILSFLLYGVCELILLFILSLCLKLNTFSIFSDSVYQIIGIFLSNLLFLIIIEIIIYLKKDQSSIIVSFRTELLLIIGTDMLFITIFIGLFYYDNRFLTINTAMFFMYFAVVLISIISFFTLYKVAKKSAEIMQTNLKLQQMEMENKLTENMEDVVNNLRNLRHDMNNHLGILQGLLSLKEYNEANQYLESIMQDLNVANNFVFVDHKLLSVLINSKVNRALALNIPIEIEILVNTFPLNDKDLCSLVGNILENAIEAAMQAKEPQITFSMKKEYSQLIIQCDNTYLIEPIFHNGQLITRKDDKRYHGLGTQIIKSIVEAYHGELNFLVDDLFHVSICIPY